MLTFSEKILEVEGLEKESELVLVRMPYRTVRFEHTIGCCESVYLEDWDGEISGILNSVDVVEGEEMDTEGGDIQFTYVTIHSSAGYCHMRWIGESNGYYSTAPEITVKGEDNSCRS